MVYRPYDWPSSATRTAAPKSREGLLNRKLFAAFAAILVIAGIALGVVVTGGAPNSKDESVARHDGDRDRARDSDREGKYGEDPRKEAAFENERGGEANRRGPRNPVVEQVENRAYPR